MYGVCTLTVRGLYGVCTGFVRGPRSLHFRGRRPIPRLRELASSCARPAAALRDAPPLAQLLHCDAPTLKRRIPVRDLLGVSDAIWTDFLPQFGLRLAYYVSRIPLSVYG